MRSLVPISASILNRFTHCAVRSYTVPSKLSSNRVTMTTPPRVELTETEDKICDLLDNCTKYLKAEKNITTSCRIAGGWVRDKLLGMQSNDIDIALSDMMGVPFAEHLLQYATKEGLEVGTIAKIESNPGQSKHLETARFTVYDTELDLVNLRSEEYASDSRIPTQVTFGTPLQDALRRDITINTLFYNVHTRAVEDFTEKGLPDLRDGIIRTPLSPKETFMDDPLRVIRCVRFASRLDFKMVEELEEAAKNKDIQAALESKISRERIGEELSKMLKGANPLLSTQMIDKLGLYHSVFSVLPPDIKSALPPQPSSTTSSVTASLLLRALFDPLSAPQLNLKPIHPTLFTSVNSDPTCKARLYLAAVLTPYMGVRYTDHKGKEHLAVEGIIKEALKLGVQNHYSDGVPALYAATALLKNPDIKKEGLQIPLDRVAIGLLLREKAVHNLNTGSHWTSSLLFSLIQELVPFYDIATDELNEGEANRVIEVYNTFINKVEELDLIPSIEAKPILDGKEVLKALGSKRPGQWTGKVLNKIVEWQLQYPSGTKEECVEWLKGEKVAGRVVVEDEVLPEPSPKKKKVKR